MDSANKSLPNATHVGCAWHVQLELDEVTILAQEEILDGFGVHFSQGGAELIFFP